MKKLLLCFYVTITFYSVKAQPVIPNKVASWSFNGNFLDGSGNGINGTNFGATATTNKFAQANSAMSFSNPTGSVVAYATHPSNTLLNYSGNQNFSVSFVTFINSPLVHTVGFYDNNLNYGGYGIWLWDIGAGPELHFNYKNASLGILAVPLGQWLHICAVREAGVLKLYLNGVLKGTLTEGTWAPLYNFPGRFGSMFYNAQTPPQYNGLNGKLDEVSIYNRALTSAEILSLANALLPMKLGNFSVASKNGTVRLFWQTFTESQSRDFSIERSADGSNFSKIGEVAAAGQSALTKDYEFTDVQPLTGNAFYRLRMNDLDGTSSVSRVIVVNTASKTSGVKLYPNPVGDNIQFQISGNEGEKVKVEVIDMAGRLHYSQFINLKEGNQNISLPLIPISKGLYQLRVSGQARTQVVSFVKN